MYDKNRDTVFIEHCINCKYHAWCTSHNEKKYIEFFQKGMYIKKDINKKYQITTSKKSKEGLKKSFQRRFMYFKMYITMRRN